MAIGMLISAAGIVGLTNVESLWIYTPLFLITGIGLGLGWALANVATQAVVPPAFIGAASGITVTCLVMLGAGGVAVAAAMIELLSGSVSGAASDARAINTVFAQRGCPRHVWRGRPAGLRTATSHLPTSVLLLELRIEPARSPAPTINYRMLLVRWISALYFSTISFTRLMYSRLSSFGASNTRRRNLLAAK